MKYVLKTIYSIFQCFMVGIVCIGLLMSILAISIIGLFWLMLQIPHTIGSIIGIILLFLLGVCMAISSVVIGNDILHKF